MHFHDIFRGVNGEVGKESDRGERRGREGTIERAKRETDYTKSMKKPSYILMKSFL